MWMNSPEKVLHLHSKLVHQAESDHQSAVSGEDPATTWLSGFSPLCLSRPRNRRSTASTGRARREPRILVAAIISGLIMGQGFGKIFTIFFHTLIKSALLVADDRGDAGIGHAHPLLRSGRHHGACICAYRPSLSILRHVARVARRRAHRFGHFLKRTLRQSAEDHRAASSRLRRP